MAIGATHIMDIKARRKPIDIWQVRASILVVL
jgi:hypothetical protein